MLYYENGSVGIGSVNVKIPDGVFWETNTENVFEVGFELASPGEDFRITVTGDNEEKDALSYLRSMTHNVGFKILGDPERIEINGLKGWKLQYIGSKEKVLYCEFALDIPKTKEAHILDIYLRANAPADMDKIISSRIVQELLNGITQV